MQRKRLRGGDRLQATIQQMGLLEREATYPLGTGNGFHVPLNMRPYDMDFVLTYEKDLIERVVEASRSLGDAVVLIDCGADIGLIGCRLTSELPAISRVIALEPNPAAYPYLEKNLAALPADARAINAAVSDYVGKGRLERGPPTIPIPSTQPSWFPPRTDPLR